MVSLNGENYATWKIQCKMALLKEDLWDHVDGTVIVPIDKVQLLRNK